MIEFVYTVARKNFTAFSCLLFCYPFLLLLFYFYLHCSFVHFIYINAAISDNQFTKLKENEKHFRFRNPFTYSQTDSKLYSLFYDTEISQCSCQFGTYLQSVVA